MAARLLVNAEERRDTLPVLPRAPKAMTSLTSTEAVNGDPIAGGLGSGDAILGTVIAELGEIFRSRAISPPALGAETVLDAATLGLESLDFAELVVRLEQALGKDPFAQGEIPEIRTIHDLALVYH
jgi:acyl carrier protein